MKQIKLPKKDVENLFKFLEDNQIDEYIHHIKRVEDKSQGKDSYNSLLRIEKDRFGWWWFGTFLVGVYFITEIIEKWKVISQFDSWVGFLLFFGIIGVLICSHFFFKMIVEIFIYKNKFVRIDEDKVSRKPRYFSNLEPVKFQDENNKKNN